MSRPWTSIRFATVAWLVAGLSACSDDPVALTNASVVAGPQMSTHGSAPPPPPGLVAVGPLELWPWTGRDVSGTIADPMNVLFTGAVDVVSLRAALMSLDGDRTAYGFPPVYPFDCTWNDAHGEMQTTYSNGAGWVANAIQLQCGNYAPLRFHVRLFDAGEHVLAGAHLDLLIPNTPEHEIISLEAAEQLLAVDFVRSGFLAAAPSAVAFQTAGTPRTIRKAVYDGMPDALKVAFGLPPGPAPEGGVGVPNDGMATVLDLATRAPVVAGLEEYGMSLPFDLPIPRPFCNQGPTDFVVVLGTVELTVRTRVSGSGFLETHNTLRGDLAITPIDVFTGLPSGPTFRAQISEIDNTSVGPNGTRVNAIQLRKALPPGDAFLKTHLVTAPNGAAHFASSEKCN